jgi:hypothetical protein
LLEQLVKLLMFLKQSEVFLELEMVLNLAMAGEAKKMAGVTTIMTLLLM